MEERVTDLETLIWRLCSRSRRITRERRGNKNLLAGSLILTFRGPVVLFCMQRVTSGGLKRFHEIDPTRKGMTT
jgi:hypothetical protein